MLGTDNCSVVSPLSIHVDVFLKSMASWHVHFQELFHIQHNFSDHGNIKMYIVIRDCSIIQRVSPTVPFFPPPAAFWTLVGWALKYISKFVELNLSKSKLILFIPKLLFALGIPMSVDITILSLDFVRNLGFVTDFTVSLLFHQVWRLAQLLSCVIILLLPFLSPLSKFRLPVSLITVVTNNITHPSFFPFPKLMSELFLKCSSDKVTCLKAFKLLFCRQLGAITFFSTYQSW